MYMKMEKGVKIDIFKELNKFNEVVFTERGHTYTVGGQKATSVTTFIGQFKETFERDFWAARSAEKENVKLQDILDRWDSISLRACNKGSKFHAFAENYINNKILTNTMYDFDLDKKSYDKIESYFIQFYEESKTNLIPIRSELCVGSRDLGICGMVDQLYYSTPLDGLVIFDWKTNKKMNYKSRYQKKMLGPVSHLDECEFSTYSLQLSLYKYIIEYETNLKIKDCFIVWFNENNSSYQVLKCNNYTQEIVSMLDYN
jgi:ATP-dependent exoDNAse (exonuclease V) beta subunit